MDWDFVCRWFFDALSWIFQPELIGFTAIILTLITIKQTRTHNKLSVEPILSSSFNINDSISAHLFNCGLGPAIIVYFEILYHGKKVNDLELCRFLDKKFEKFISKPTAAGHFYGEYVVDKGESLQVLTLFLNEEGVSNRDAIEGYICKALEVNIKYKSVYGGKPRSYKMRGHYIFSNDKNTDRLVSQFISSGIKS